MDQQVMQNSVEVQEKSKKKLYLVIGTLLIFLFLSLLLIVVLLTSKSVVIAPVQTPTPNPVSIPTIRVGEPTPAPINVPSTLTKYTFDADYGFNMMYDASKWEITRQADHVLEASESTVGGFKYFTTFKPISDNAGNEFTINFKKMQVAMENGNVQTTCSSNYKIIKEQGPAGSEVPPIPGLIRVYLQGNGYVYAQYYYSSGTDASQLCINVNRGIYATESVPGGEGVAGGDTNDIYWVAQVIAGPSNPYIDEVDQMVSTIKFKGQ